jgi:phage shock protein PspC (stress-responsive transcriptional regulator)
MKKITDRFILGVIAGLAGNIAKKTVEHIAIKAVGFNETGAKKAAGIFLKKTDMNSP